MHQLTIYTDGAARGNPGPGGYGIVLLWGDKRKELSAGYRLTTNNRMELLAVIVALGSLTKQHIPVTIYTDSQYVVNSIEKNGSTTGYVPISKAEKRTRISGCSTMPSPK